MFGSRLKYFMGKSFRLLLLFLFLGYYGSITFFTHSHIINGVTIVHSHPFNSDRGGSPSNSQHSDKELLVIQLLSELITVVFAITFASFIVRFLLSKIPIVSIKNGYSEPGGYCTSPRRGPPSEMQFSI
ncbi:MAG TPA: hypothetical protein VGK38_15725 [Prolixibacteraceae bacterium]